MFRQCAETMWRIGAYLHPNGKAPNIFLSTATLKQSGVRVQNGELLKDNELNAFNGTRKLVRPHLVPSERRREPSHTEDPLTHAMTPDAHGVPESTHAEAFYFQKQMQQHTEMTVVLQDGEEIHGIFEWYDKCVVKVKAGRRRVMVYKAAIKYIYKTSEAAVAGVMK